MACKELNIKVERGVNIYIYIGINFHSFDEYIFVVFLFEKLSFRIIQSKLSKNQPYIHIHISTG